jgi:hypothetical protein
MVRRSLIERAGHRQGGVPMKVLHASVLLAALVAGPALSSAPAFAQDESPHINLLADGPGKTQEEIDKAKEVEKAYKDTLRTIPDAAASNDPWGNVRSEGQPKAKAASHAKTAKPKAHTATRNSAN